MAPLPFSDGFFGLAPATDARRGIAVLKPATEIFVEEPRHTRTSIAVYEELALQLIRTTSHQDLLTVARLLAESDMAPPSVLKALLAEAPDIAGVVLAKAKTLTTVDMLALVATGSLDHLNHLAARPDLPADVVDALLRKLPAETLPALLGNHTIRLPREAIPGLIETARGRPAVASALANRLHDVDETALTDLFLDLDTRGRRRVIQALELLALRDFAARRPLPHVVAPDRDQVEQLARMTLMRDTTGVSEILAQVLAIDGDLLRQLLSDTGGEPLAIALRAAGIEAPIATRVILFSGTEDVRNYFEVKRLVELFETVSLRSAALLVDRWRSARPARPARYVPQTEAGTPVRARQAGAPPAPSVATPGVRQEKA